MVGRRGIAMVSQGVTYHQTIIRANTPFGVDICAARTPFSTAASDLPEIAHTECTQSVGVFLPTSSDYISYHSIYSSSNIFLNIFSSSKMSAAGASSLPLLRGMHACLVSKMRPWIICHLCSFPVIRKSNPSTPPALARYPSLAHPPGTHAHPRAMTASAPCMVHARWCVVRGAGSPHSQTECT